MKRVGWDGLDWRKRGTTWVEWSAELLTHYSSVIISV